MTTEVEIKKIGDQFVLPLNQELLDKLGIQNGGKVEVTISETKAALKLANSDNERKREFKQLKEKMFDEYADVFTALAEGAK